MNNKTLGLGLLLLLGFIWGTGYSIARFATTHGVPPLGYSFWQSVGPALLIAFLAKSQRDSIKLSATHVRYYCMCGLTGIVIPNTTMYFAASHLPAGILAVVVNTVPIIAYPLALLLQAEKFNPFRLSGVLCAMCGLLLILLPQTSLPAPDMFLWVLAALLTPFSFALCSVYISRYRPTDSSSVSLSAGTLIAASVILAPFVLGSGHFYSLHLPLTVPDWIVLLEIALSSAGYILFFQLIKIAGPVYYSLVDTIVALVGLWWGYIIFHERLNEWTFPAVLLIFIALILVTKPTTKPLTATA